MSVVLSAILSGIIVIFMLGVLITVHEWGHYVSARLCKMNVREFAIGMGPVLFSRQKQDDAGNPVNTKFTLRAFPIGGFCDLGEDETGEKSSSPDHFRNKKLWQKVFVLASGAIMNILIGFIILIIINCTLIGREAPFSMDEFLPPTVVSLDPQSPAEGHFQEGDEFYKINGHRIVNAMDFAVFYNRDKGQPMDFVVVRNGEKVKISGLSKVPKTDENGEPIVDESGNMATVLGFNIDYTRDVVTIGRVLPRAGYMTVNYVRLIWVSLGDMISGQVSRKEIMGPVGIGGVIHDVVTAPVDETEKTPIINRMLIILGWFSILAVNLAVVNMLPIPAIDGGRIVFLFISAFLVLVRKKPLNENVEGYIHGITMMLLLGLMGLIFFNDILNRWWQG
ncbi:MAG: site-2 protease family protein [Oscillospiraceae bacterium]|nr:site-2 protease family protein [Oscillospiraceae bacterium]